MMPVVVVLVVAVLGERAGLRIGRRIFLGVRGGKG